MHVVQCQCLLKLCVTVQLHLRSSCNEGKTEIQLGPSYDNVHSYKELIHWCLEYLSYTFNNTDVDALWMPSKSLSIWASLLLYKKVPLLYITHPKWVLQGFTLSFCRILVFQWQWRWVIDSWSSLESSTHNAPSCWQVQEIDDGSAFLSQCQQDDINELYWLPSI